MRIARYVCFAVTLAMLCAGVCAAQRLRLYVLDNGVLEGIDPASYHLAKDEVREPTMSCVSYLLVHTAHGKTETLVWDSGSVPDADIEAGRGELKFAHMTMKASTTLRAQLAAAGYKLSDITYFALSHSHFDHVANANAFAASTWILQRREYEMMLRTASTQPNYAAVKTVKTQLLDGDDYDVFGDGTVVVKAAYGHTPGHQVLVVKLAETGTVVLAGDLYHYRAQIGTPRVAGYEFNKDQTAASRGRIEEFAKSVHAQLWVGHDLEALRQQKKAPAYYR